LALGPAFSFLEADEKDERHRQRERGEIVPERVFHARNLGCRSAADDALRHSAEVNIPQKKRGPDPEPLRRRQLSEGLAPRTPNVGGAAGM